MVNHMILIVYHIQLDIYWESKIGSAGIIRHDLFEIEGDSYGQLTQIYKKLKVVNEILLFKDFNSKNLLKVFKCA